MLYLDADVIVQGDAAPSLSLSLSLTLTLTRYWRFHSELGRLYVEAAEATPKPRKPASARQRKSALAMPSQGSPAGSPAGARAGASGGAAGGGGGRPAGATTWRYHRSRED